MTVRKAGLARAGWLVVLLSVMCAQLTSGPGSAAAAPATSGRATVQTGLSAAPAVTAVGGGQLLFLPRESGGIPCALIDPSSIRISPNPDPKPGPHPAWTPLLSFRSTYVGSPSGSSMCFGNFYETAVCSNPVTGTYTWSKFGPSEVLAPDHPQPTTTWEPCIAETDTLLMLVERAIPASSILGYWPSDSFDIGFTWWNTSAGASGPLLAEQGGWGSALTSGSCGICLRPVNTASGAHLEFGHDIAAGPVVKGRGPGLSWSRAYSSMQPSVGPLGAGWSFDYGARLVLAGAAGTGATAVFVDGSGSSSPPFTKQADGSWKAPTRTLASLVQAADGTFRLTRFGSNDSWAFDAAGRLSALADSTGAKTVVSYTNGNVSSVADSSGRSIVVRWAGTTPDHISAVTSPQGAVTSYGYTNNDLTSVTDPAGRITRYGYDAVHQLVTVTGPDGGVTTTTFSGGRVTKQVDPVGATTTFAYSGDPTTSVGSTTTMTDSHGQVTTHTYRNLQLVEVDKGSATSPNIARTRYVYDPVTFARVVTVSPDGGVTQTPVDLRGNLVAVIDPTGRRVRYTYDSRDHVTSVTSPANHTTTYDYTVTAGTSTTVSNYLQAVKAPDSGTTSYAYGDAAHPGDVTKVTDADGRVTTFSRDPYGNVAQTRVTDHGGRVSVASAAYTLDGDLYCTVAPEQVNAGVTCPVYTTSPTVPLGATWVARDGSGLVVDTWDAAGNRTHVTRTFGTTASGPSGAGMVALVTDALGHGTQTVFDKVGRPVSSTKGSGAAATTSSTAYDVRPGSSGAGAGSPKCPTAVGASTAVNWCTAATDGMGRTSATAFDVIGNAVGQVAADGTTTVNTYDLAGRVLRVTRSDSSTITATYDLAGRVLSRVTAGGPSANASPNVAYTYNLEGQLSSMVDAADGSGVQYTYSSASGNLVSTARGSWSRSGAFTAVGGTSVGYGWDKTGHVTSLTYPDGRLVSRSVDALGTYGVSDGQQSATGAPAPNSTGFTVDRDGVVTGATSATPGTPGGSGTTSTSVDRNGLPVAVSASVGGSVLAGLDWGVRSPVGQIVSEAVSGSAGGLIGVSAVGAVTYDSASRLQSTSAGSAPGAIGLNAAGDPTSLPGPRGLSAQAYDPRGNAQLVSSSAPLSEPPGVGLSYRYSGNGDRVSATVTTTTPAGATSWSYGYDPMSHLSSSRPAPTSALAPTTTYSYDGDGLRRSKTTNGVATNFVYDVTTSPPTLLTDGTRDYVWAQVGTGRAWVPVQQTKAGRTPTGYLSDASQTAWYFVDQNLSTRALLTPSGTGGKLEVASTYGYSPYGYGARTAGVSATADTPLRYGGGYTDAETGLVYLVTRYYDPATAQFLTRDPAFALTGSAYSYAAGDPINATDRGGLCPTCIIAVAGAALGGAASTQNQDYVNGLNGCPSSGADYRAALEGSVGGGMAAVGMFGGMEGLGSLGGAAAKSGDELVNLASEARTIHILQGDATGGGHLWPGLPGKTPFPKSWSSDRVMHEISDVASDPASIFTRGRGGGTVVTGSRDGVDIRVILRGGDIITSYPTNLARNPLMPAADFDELLGRIRGVLISLGPVLSSEEAGEVDELIDHAELGEGLRTLAWLLVEESKPTSESDILEIQALAARMGISHELPPAWRAPWRCDG